MNPKLIEPDLLSPAKTDYRKYVLYDTLDVTHALVTGRNVSEVILRKPGFMSWVEL